jgi:hypothetical protein
MGIPCPCATAPGIKMGLMRRLALILTMLRFARQLMPSAGGHGQHNFASW